MTTRRDCPNRPEWAAPVPAIQTAPDGSLVCSWCSKTAGAWVPCEATPPPDPSDGPDYHAELAFWNERQRG